MIESFKADLSEKIAESTEGQEPSWRNLLSRTATEHLGKKDKESPPPLTIEASVEKPEIKTQLGTAFELMVSAIAEKSPPPIIESGSMSALLATNEYFDLEEIRIDLQTVPDGYIFGVGAGNIYSLVHLFESEKPPKAIVSVDVLPEAVLAGRVAVQLLRKATSFDDFLTTLRSEQLFHDEISEAIDRESSEVVKQRLQSVDPEKLIKDIRYQTGDIPNTGIVQHGVYERISVFAAIRDRWDMLQKLAKDGNIGIGLADVTNTEIITGVAGSTDFSDSSNVVYVSNIIDHITARGTNFGENDERLGFIQPLQSLDNGKSIFIDTLQSYQYKLRVSSHLPKYTLDDFKIVSLV